MIDEFVILHVINFKEGQLDELSCSEEGTFCGVCVVGDWLKHPHPAQVRVWC